MSPGHDFLACCHVGQLGIRTLRERKIEQASGTDDSDYAFLPIGPFSAGRGGAQPGKERPPLNRDALLRLAQSCFSLLMSSRDNPASDLQGLVIFHEVRACL